LNLPISNFVLPTEKLDPEVLIKNLIDYSEADSKLKLLESLNDKFSNHYEFQYFLGMSLATAGKELEAIKILENVQSINPGRPDVLLQLITLYSSQNNFEKILNITNLAKGIFRQNHEIREKFESIENKIKKFLN